MRILANDLNNNYNPSSQGTLKIWSNKQANFLTDKSIKKIEKRFAERTQDGSEHMEVLLIDRYGVKNAQSDKIMFTDTDYADYTNFQLKNCEDENSLLEKLIDTYNLFRKIRELREGIQEVFK